MQKFLLLFIVVLLFSCGGGSKETSGNKREVPKTANQEQNKNNDWEKVLTSVAKIDSYDGKRILESGQGFFVDTNLLVTKFSLVARSTVVHVKPFNEHKTYFARKFVAFDRINDLIILEVDSIKRKPIVLAGKIPESAKSIYMAPKTTKTIQLFTGKVLNLASEKGVKLYRITNKIRPSQFGAPIFVSNKKAIGAAFAGTVNYQPQSFAIPSMYIAGMLKNKKNKAQPLETLKVGTNPKIAAENKKVKGLVLETDYGNITIKLFNQTPMYRDNFIRLTKEHYFDSLLIHRVIPDFGIQSGAADTRYAQPGDNVGWKGPGYTIPAHIVAGLFHKRGMIGSPRKPDTQNQRQRSDGSQFYIVSGRKYSDKDLDEIEKENNYKFSAKQRQVYKTTGGAPHLDGSYTVFGQVISGMNIVDRMVKVKTDKRWRPLKDIRIKKIRILK